MTKRHFTLGIRGRLLAGVLIGILPLLAFAGVVLVRLAESQRETIQARVDEKANLLALAVDREISSAQSLASGLATSPLLDRGDFRGFHEQVRGILSDGKRWIVLFNPERDQLVNSARAFGMELPTNVRAPAVDEVLATGKPAVMDLLTGSVVGVPVVGTSVPVIRDGKIVYVLALTFSAEGLSSMLAAEPQPAGWTVALLDRTGRIVARNRTPERYVGEPAVDPLRQAVADADHGNLFVPTMEGDLTYAAFDRSVLSGWSVVVGAPVQVLEQPMRRSLTLLIGGGAALLLLSSGLALWNAQRIMGPVRSLSALAAAIGRDEGVAPPALSGISEIDEVARALVGSAHSLRIHERDRDLTVAALRENETRLRRAHEAGGIGEWEWNPQSGILRWSDSMSRLVGREPGTFDPLGTSLGDVIHPADRDRVLAEAQDVIAGQRLRFDTQFRVARPDGAVRWLVSRGDREAGRDEPARLVGVSYDITGRKETEERQRILVNELNHRVKNNLAAVQAIAMEARRSSTSADDFYRRFEERLLALSRTHELLTREAWEGVDLGGLALAILGPFGLRGGERIGVDGPSVRLSPNTAVSLGMVFHELATNAAKYGSLSAAHGTVRLGWSIADEGVWLTWEERGGPLVDAPSRRGFGLRLIEQGLARQIRGKVTIAFDPPGVQCRIVMPLEGNAAAPG